MLQLIIHLILYQYDLRWFCMVVVVILGISCSLMYSCFYASVSYSISQFAKSSWVMSSFAISKGARGARGAKGPTGKPGEKVSTSVCFPLRRFQHLVSQLLMGWTHSHHQLSFSTFISGFLLWLCNICAGHRRTRRRSGFFWRQGKEMNHTWVVFILVFLLVFLFLFFFYSKCIKFFSLF